MFDREHNIDIVFRNGLKDLEVLPPGDVWDNIPPMPRVQRHYGVPLGIAAGIAVLFTLTLLASWFTRDSEPSSNSTRIASLINEGETTITPDLLKSSVFTKVSPEKVLNVTSSDFQVREEEKTISNAALASLPSLASKQKEPLTTKSSVSTPIINNNNQAIFPQKLFNFFNRTDQLALLEKPKMQGQRFMLGASLSPSMGFSSSQQDARLTELLSSEKGVPTYATGLTFAYKISQRFSIQSGVGIASLGQVVTGIDVFAGLSDYYSVKGGYLYRVETASGMLVSGNPDLYLADSQSRVGTFIPGDMADPSKYPLTLIDNEVHQVFRYLEFPLLVRYKIIDRDVDLNISGGMSYGFLFQNSAYAMDGNNMVNVGHTEGVNIHTISSQLGLGMEYNISKLISFNVEPVFRYYLTPFSDLTGTISRPYSFGLSSGFFFRF